MLYNLILLQNYIRWFNYSIKYFTNLMSNKNAISFYNISNPSVLVILRIVSLQAISKKPSQGNVDWFSFYYELCRILFFSADSPLFSVFLKTDDSQKVRDLECSMSTLFFFLFFFKLLTTYWRHSHTIHVKVAGATFLCLQIWDACTAKKMLFLLRFFVLFPVQISKNILPMG